MGLPLCRRGQVRKADLVLETELFGKSLKLKEIMLIAIK